MGSIAATMYHGTHQEFDVFRVGQDAGIWFSSSLEYAREYGQRIVAASLVFDNPYITTPDEFDKGGFTAALAQAEGRDAYVMDYGDSKDIAVFRSEQILDVVRIGLRSVGLTKLLTFCA